MWEMNVCERVKLRQWSVIFPPRGTWAPVFMYTEWKQAMGKSCVFCVFTEHLDGGRDSQVVVGVCWDKCVTADWQQASTPPSANILYNGDQLVKSMSSGTSNTALHPVCLSVQGHSCLTPLVIFWNPLKPRLKLFSDMEVRTLLALSIR